MASQTPQTLRGKLALKATEGLSDEEIAAVITDVLSKRPTHEKLGEALIVRIANGLPVANDQGQGTPMLGMKAVDSLTNNDPTKPLSQTISNYNWLLGGASTAVIAEKDGIPYVLLGDSEDRKRLVVPQGYYNPHDPMSPQGLHTVHTSAFSAYEHGQENGTPQPTVAINTLTSDIPQGDADKRANAVRELQEETGVVFPAEKLLFVDEALRDEVRTTKAMPDQLSQNDDTFFLADMRGTNTLPAIKAADDLPTALWAPITEIVKTQGTDGAVAYTYQGKPIDRNIAVRIEKGMGMLRDKEFEAIGLTKERIIKFADARAKALGTANPLDPVPGELSKEAIEWHKQALEIAQEMDKTLLSTSSQSANVGMNV